MYSFPSISRMFALIAILLVAMMPFTKALESQDSQRLQSEPTRALLNNEDLKRQLASRRTQGSFLSDHGEVFSCALYKFLTRGRECPSTRRRLRGEPTRNQQQDTRHAEEEELDDHILDFHYSKSFMPGIEPPPPGSDCVLFIVYLMGHPICF